MKKLFAILMAAAVIICGNLALSSTADAKAGNNISPEVRIFDFAFQIGDQVNFADIEKELGKAEKYDFCKPEVVKHMGGSGWGQFKNASVNIIGMKVADPNGKVSTNDVGQIKGIIIKGGSSYTYRGIKTGDSVDKVLERYGDPVVKPGKNEIRQWLHYHAAITEKLAFGIDKDGKVAQIYIFYKS